MLWIIKFLYNRSELASHEFRIFVKEKSFQLLDKAYKLAVALLLDTLNLYKSLRLISLLFLRFLNFFKLLVFSFAINNFVHLDSLVFLFKIVTLS